MPLIKLKKKNPFEASMPIDNPDIKVVTASFQEKPFFIGIGTSKQRELSISGEGSMEKLAGKYQTQKELEWQFLYNPKVLPDFMPMERLKNLMAGTVAVTSGSIDVFTPQTEYREANPRTLRYISPSDITTTTLDELERRVNRLIKKKEETERKT
jgi:hypothetical protein